MLREWADLVVGSPQTNETVARNEPSCSALNFCKFLDQPCFARFISSHYRQQSKSAGQLIYYA